ncbi:uncharacterized protein LOC132739884 isoform X2 [Ruditapes philippinarum]|uniref:uncharacterized protein LOC132739884 isoform X2 n=1 Tax=Ruditapes philippinarum TaxID=129788 RepID=UPI00295AD2C9|nr:uncharacterized protein LOC132739884 isoform X2 [Ruditapes philippinarum]
MPRGRRTAVTLPTPQEEDRNARTTRGRKRPASTALTLEDSVDERMLQNEADVWILGDSIPYWAGNYAKNAAKENLGLKDVSIAWWAERGLRWGGFRRLIEMQVLLSFPPSIIFIHLGGNDLVSVNTVQLRLLIEQEIIYLREAFPHTVIIWVDILQRQNWSGAIRGYRPIEMKRKRLNRLARKIVTSSGLSDIIIPDIDAATAFFRDDGVHLNSVGLEFYLDYIKDAIVKHLGIRHV